MYQKVGRLDGLFAYLDLQGKKLTALYLCLGLLAFVIMRYVLIPSEPLWPLMLTYFPYLAGWAAYVYKSPYFYASICFGTLRWSFASNLFLVLVNSSLLIVVMQIFPSAIFSSVLCVSMFSSCAFGYYLMVSEVKSAL